MADDVIDEWARRMRGVYFLRRGSPRMAERTGGREARRFRELASFVLSRGVPAPLTYAAWLAARGVPPRRWCSGETVRDYVRQLPRFERRADAQARLVHEASRWCGEHAVDPGEDPVASMVDLIEERELCRMLLQGRIPLSALARHPRGAVRLRALGPQWRVALHDAFGADVVRALLGERRGAGA